jgi:galactokinase
MINTQKLIELYGSKNLDFQSKRYSNIGEIFKSKYGSYDFFVSSSGRIEICGNHTDHNHGMALASAIDLDTVGAVKKVDGNIITVDSEGYEPFSVDITDLEKRADEENSFAFHFSRKFQKFFKIRV